MEVITDAVGDIKDINYEKRQQKQQAKQQKLQTTKQQSIPAIKSNDYNLEEDLDNALDKIRNSSSRYEAEKIFKELLDNNSNSKLKSSEIIDNDEKLIDVNDEYYSE